MSEQVHRRIRVFAAVMYGGIGTAMLARGNEWGMCWLMYAAAVAAIEVCE